MDKETIKVRLDMLAGETRRQRYDHPAMMHAIGFIGGLECAGAISHADGDAFMERLERERREAGL